MRASDLRKVNGLDPHFITREELIREFVQLLRSGNASLFVGAGISMDCGLPSWMGLIKEFLKKMGFKPEDIKGLDNYDLMNWYCQFNNDRATLIQEIIHQLNQQGTPSVNHQIIARLPLMKIWTTNYDTLIETALEQQKRKVKVLSSDEDFPFSERENVKVFKVHGTRTAPNDIVITRDDIDNYPRKYEVMLNAFLSALVQDSFLFLGFGFQDINFKAILGRISSRFKDIPRRHFAVMQRPKELKDQIPFYCMINDLAHKGIKVCIIESYDEIPFLLMDIERAYIRSNAFISGSFDKEYPNKPVNYPSFSLNGYKQSSRLEEASRRSIDVVKRFMRSKVFPFNDSDHILQDFLEQLGASLFVKEFALYTGYGLGVCNVVLDGATHKLSKEATYPVLGDKINVFPLFGNTKVQPHHQFYRLNMIGKCGFMLSVRGANHASDYTSGSFDEYAIARGLSNLLTGRQKIIWRQVKECAQQLLSIEGGNRKPIKDRLQELRKNHATLVYYKHQEVIEIFHRLFYEQWKIVMRSLDACKYRIDILIRHECPDYLEAWIPIKAKIEELVYNRIFFFNSQFNGQYLQRRHDFKEPLLMEILEGLQELAKPFKQKRNKLKDNLAALLSASRKLVCGDYKYLRLHHFIYRLEQAEYNYLQARYVAGDIDLKKATELAEKYEQGFYDFIDFLYNYMENRDHYTQDPNKTVNPALSSLLDEGMREGLKFHEHKCFKDATKDNFKEAHKSWLINHYWREMPDVETAGSPASQEGKDNELHKWHSKYLIYKIQFFKYVFLLCDFKRSLTRLEANQQIVEIKEEDPVNHELQKSLLYGERSYIPAEVDTYSNIADLTTDPMVYDPKDIRKYLELHKRYYQYYAIHYEILRCMIGFKRSLSLLLKTDSVSKTLHEAERSMMAIEQLEGTQDLRHKSVPFRSATVVLPIAAFGGMARKLWKEERIRFDYLCSNLNFEDVEEERGNKTCRELLLAQYNQLYGGDLSAKVGEEVRAQRLKELQRAIFYIIEQFQKPPRKLW